MKKKLCVICKKKKLLKEFYKNKKNSDGRSYRCIQCKKLLRLKYKSKELNYAKNYRESHKEKCAKYAKEYFEKYRKRNKEKLKQYSKEYYQKNKDILKVKKAKYRKKNRILIRIWKLRNKFDISLEEAKKLYNKKINGVCDICGKPESSKRFMLAVDHNHKTGKIRGLLCGSCNRGLGYLKDSVAILTKAIKYLNERN